MSLVPVFDSNPQGGRWCFKLASFPRYTYALFQVIGPATLFLARDDKTLLTDLSFGRQGLQVTQNTGILRLWWRGDLWISSSMPSFVEFIGFEGTDQQFGLQHQNSLVF
jgi:hypothetical protein